ncbi:MAG: hypothetical protein JST64_10345, partial [Actinobacteria bacterium]|nr:hypothetical protein [Actinomycetota bacterium]
RARLEEALDAVPPGGVGRLVAAAGCGKSLLIAQWLASNGSTGARSISVAGRHNDAMSFGADLLEAFGDLQRPLDPSLREHLVSGSAGLGADFFDRLVSDLAAQPCQVVLVLDDLHQLTNEGVLDDLGWFLQHLPPNVRVVAAMRWDVALSTRQLRMAGKLVEVRAAELAFTPEEARRMVRSLSGHELDDRQVELLVDRTEGWAAGLQLASISLRTADDPDDFLHDFAGTDRLVVEYLTAEVLCQLDAPTRSFLLRTSVLPWLTADLCAAVTGRDDSREVLDHLHSHSMFLIELDRCGTRYRYHHLFRELLLHAATLELGVDELGTLRRSSAEWFRHHGAVSEAVEQLLDAEAWADGFELVRHAGDQFFQQGNAATLASWMSRIDRHDRDAPAAVPINLMAAQIAACQFTPAAETHRRLRQRDDLTRGESIAVEALFCCCALDGLPASRAVEVASRVLGELDDADLAPTAAIDFLSAGGRDSIEILAGVIKGLALFHLGRTTDAVVALETACTMPGMQHAMWRMNALGALALVRAWTGHLDDAQRLASSAVAFGVELGVQRHVALSSARLALGLVAIERNAPLEAAEHLGAPDHPAFLLRGSTDLDTRSYLLARLASLREGPDAALTLLDEPMLGAEPPPIIGRARRALRARQQLATGDLVSARVTLGSGCSDRFLDPVRFDLELAAGDRSAARLVLERWRPDDDDLLDRVQHGLRDAVLLDAEGETAASSTAVLGVVATAEPEGLVGPFLECSAVIPLLERTGRSRPRPFLRRLLDAAREAGAVRSGQAQLIDHLTERELEVLAYLPTRLSNADIGQRTFMSVNTVKTHLRNIYRKLDAGDRDAAVERARSLGLL